MTMSCFSGKKFKDFCWKRFKIENFTRSKSLTQVDRKSKLWKRRQPTYKYDTQKDLFYEEFDDMIVEFTKLIKHNINYKLHNVFTDGILDDDTYMMFYFENPNFYFGRIDSEYLIFIKEDVGSLQKEIITKKILLSCINKL